jgi:hypothetical protein
MLPGAAAGMAGDGREVAKVIGKEKARAAMVVIGSVMTAIRFGQRARS